MSRECDFRTQTRREESRGGAEPVAMRSGSRCGYRKAVKDRLSENDAFLREPRSVLYPETRPILTPETRAYLGRTSLDFDCRLWWSLI